MTETHDLDNGPPSRGDDARAMVRDYADHLRRREAILPGLLIAGGVVWLAATFTRDARIAQRLHPDGALGRLKAAGDAATSRLTDAVDEAKGRADHLQAAAAEGLSGLRDKASMLGDRMQNQAQRAKRRYDASFESEPLVIAAIGVAIGAGLAALWPATLTERRLLGRTAARVTDKVKAGLNHVGAVAEDALSQAKDELHRQTGAEGEAGIVGKVGAVLQTGAKAAAGAVGSSGASAQKAQVAANSAGLLDEEDDVEAIADRDA